MGDPVQVVQDTPSSIVPVAVDPFPPTVTRTTTTEEQLTTDARLSRIEKAMADYITNPPPLPDMEIVLNKIQQAEGKADSALRQVADMSDTLPQRVGQVEARLAQAERDIQHVADAKAISMVAKKRDLAHENAHTLREWKCGKCTAGTQDIVKAAEATSAQRTCPACGGAMEIIARTAVNPDGSPIAA